MHISNPQSALLSNHELLLHLQQEEAEYSGTDGTGRARAKPSGLNHILRDGLAYLQTPDFPTGTLSTTHPNRPLTLYRGPHSLFRALAPRFRLNKAEYLQLYNVRPVSQVQLELVLEEAGTRFSEEEMGEMLEIIGGVFDEEEAGIPEGVEDQRMEKVKDKLLGARRRGRKKKT